MVVGWQISESLRSDLAIDALEMAVVEPHRDGQASTALIYHSDRGVQGGFNWSSQHLDSGGVQMATMREAAARGSAAIGGRFLRRGGRRGLARGPGPVLGGDRSRPDDRGCRRRGGRVIPGRVPVVPPRWRRESMPASDGVGPLSVVLGARGHRHLACPGLGVREIARRLGRSPSTISRSCAATPRRGPIRLDYKASTAQWHAERRARRPKVAKLVANERLRDYVQERLSGVQDGRPMVDSSAQLVRSGMGRNKPHRADRRWVKAWSPEQISQRLPGRFPR